MSDDILKELYRDLPKEERIKYTKRAFKMIPYIDKPEILDIGCGTGVPTLQIARLSGGNVTGLDINGESLNELERKAKQFNLSTRVKTIKCSMFEMNFLDEYFDIIWSEGTIFLIGFKKALKDWKKFIRLEGFLVIHEMCYLEVDPPPEISNYWEKVYPGIKTVDENLKVIPECGYKIVGYFPLPVDAWSKLYFKPLQERIDTVREKHRNNEKVIDILNREQKEVELYNKYYKWYGSAFYIMQKK